MFNGRSSLVSLRIPPCRQIFFLSELGRWKGPFRWEERCFPFFLCARRTSLRSLSIQALTSQAHPVNIHFFPLGYIFLFISFFLGSVLPSPPELFPPALKALLAFQRRLRLSPPSPLFPARRKSLSALLSRPADFFLFRRCLALPFS